MIRRTLNNIKPNIIKKINFNKIPSLRSKLRKLRLLQTLKIPETLFLTTTSTLLLMNFSNSTLKFYTDENLENTESQLNSHIKKLKSTHGESMMSFPKINYRLQGNTYKIDFLIDQRKCDIFSLLVAASNMLESSEKRNSTNKKKSRIFENIITMNKNGNMTLCLEFTESNKKGIKSNGAIHIMGEFRPDRASFKFVFQKAGEITQTDIEILKKVYELANKNTPYSTVRERNITANRAMNRAGQSTQTSKLSAALGLGGNKDQDESVKKLNEMGIVVFMPDDKKNMQGLGWDMLAGYEKQKRDIEDTVLMSLTHSEIFDDITLKTRMRFEENRAKAVLFEGPPGTGKTTSAKIIASQVGIPLLYMPLESIMSKWYGEAEQRLAEVFEGAGNLGKAIIFIDEIDAIAGSRGNGTMHEVSRRILSTLLRKIDSFESNSDVLLICATNRKQDLDEAILSRLDLSIKFPLPDEISRKEIFRRYAKHLSESDLEALAAKSGAVSGRSIYEICRDSERRWASKRIRGEVDQDLPTLKQYFDSMGNRKTSFNA